MCTFNSTPVTAGRREEQIGVDACSIGPMYGKKHELGSGADRQSIDWVRTSSTHREWLPSPELEGDLLIGLEAAVAANLIELRLVPVRGDSAAYHAIWRRCSTDDSSG